MDNIVYAVLYYHGTTANIFTGYVYDEYKLMPLFPAELST